MIPAEVRRSFELMAVGVRGEARALGAGLARQATGLGLRALAANALAVAIAAPERGAPFYDELTEGWRGHPIYARPLRTRSIPAPLPIGSAFWSGFWRLVETPDEARAPLDFTERAAFVSTLAPGALTARHARLTLGYPGLREAASWPLPPRFDRADLDRCKPGSLGAAFRKVVDARGGALEILDREAWQLQSLPAPLGYVNVRILQCHDLWRLTAGYEETLLHQLCMAAFQFGQFGHGYSALMLALVLSDLAMNRAELAPLLLEPLLAAYAHGREAPPLMPTPWPTLWNQTPEAVRARLGMRPFDCATPSDVLERLGAAARLPGPPGA